MANGVLRTASHTTTQGGKQSDGQPRDVEVEVDDSDIDALEHGTFRVLRVHAAEKLDRAVGAYKELEINGDSLVIIELAVDTKRGTTALVTVR
jgi:hypothetical protein